MVYLCTMSDVIFLDYNSTTPVDEKVMQRMLPYFTKYFGNAASKTHSYGWEADAAVQRAREEVASFIRAEPREILFTSGSTEAINIALRGAMLSYHSKGNHIVTSSTEHKAVLNTVEALVQSGCTATLLNVDKEGMINPDDVSNAITSSTVIVSIMLANNETGTLQRVSEVGRICKEKKVLFFCDATQAAGKVVIDVNEMQCDLLCLSAHKMYGPKGIGALYIRRRNPSVKLQPVFFGGGETLRPGTLNVPGIAGMGAACMLCNELFWDETARLSALRTRLEQLLEAEVPVHINGSMRNRICNTSNIAFRGVDASRLIAAIPGLAFSTGSACTSALPEPSHVLKAMGFSRDHVFSSVRFSLGRYTSEAEVDRAVNLIVSACLKLKAETST